MEHRWRKSSRSQGGEGNCVELALVERGLLARDSKCPESGMLLFADTGASAFLSAVKAGRFDR